MVTGRTLGLGLGGGLIAAAVVWALWPQPTLVDLATVTRGPMQGEITAQGVTRARDTSSITAPFPGVAIRSPVEVGDAVVAGETVVAVLQPANPTPLDARSRSQAEAAVTEAQAAVALAQSNLARAETAFAHAEHDVQRSRALADRGSLAQNMLEDAEAAHLLAAQAVAAGRAQLDLSRASLARAQAQLIGPELQPGLDSDADACCVRLFAPQTGIVLTVAEHSARPVQTGAPLLTIGNLESLEIELDLLSSDAVRVPPDARAVIERWGGEGVLEARLRRIEPAAFTRVSALGIEEQRVRLWLDLLAEPAARPGLGDGFRVQLRLIMWQAEEVLQVPQAALFRDAEGWAVFVAEGNRARLRHVTIGRQTEEQAEVLGGLVEGESVVRYPDRSLAQGTAIKARVDERAF